MKQNAILIFTLVIGVAIGFVIRDQTLENTGADTKGHSEGFSSATQNQTPGKAAQPYQPGLSKAQPFSQNTPGIAIGGGSYAEQMNLALAEGSSRQKSYALERIFDTMTVDDAPFILMDIQALESRSERRNALTVFFEKFGTLDGYAAYELASSLKGRERGIASEAAMSGWADTDIYGAWNVAIDMMDDAGNGIWRKFEAQKVFTEMATQDPDMYLSYLNQHQGNRREIHNMVRFYMKAATETGQLKQYWENLEQSSNHGNREQVVENFFREWGSVESDEPLQAIAQLENEAEAEKALRGFLRGWTISDPERALDYVFQNLENPSVDKSVRDVVGNAFFQGSAEQNRELVARIQSSALPADTYSDVVQVISRSHPSLAMEMSETVENEEQRQQLQQRAIQSLAYSDLDAATDYFKQANTPEHKVRLFNALNWQLVERSDGGERLSALLQELPPGQQRTNAIQEALVRTSYRRNGRLSADYKETLLKIASTESNLSEDATRAMNSLTQAP